MVYIKPVYTPAYRLAAKLPNWHAEQAMQFTLPKMGKRI